MSYQDAIRKSQQKLGIQKKSSGKQQEAGGYEVALAKAQAKAGVTARQEQKSQNTNAKNRLKSGTLPLSPYGEKARTQKKEQKKAYAEGKRDYETAKRERLSAEARIQAASAGGWSPNSQTGKNAQKLAQEGLNARAKEREAESRLPALEQAARAKLAAEEQERVSKLPSAKKLRETRTESGLEAARANARAQAMMANPLTADMDEYARLRGQGDRAQKTYNEATENLRARYSVNRNEESMENAAQLVQSAPLRTGAPRYTSAQTGRQREAAAAVRTILSPERYATNQTNAQLWETNKLSKLTVEEKNAILGYAGAGEWDKAADLLDSLSDTLDARQQQEESETVDRYTAQGAGGAAFGTIWNVANAMGTQPFGMVENLRQAAENLVTGDVKPANPNSFFMGGAHAVQDTTARLVQKAQGTKLGQALGNETTSFLVENGLSILQNVSRIPLGTLSETASLALMSAGAAGGTALEQAQNGVSADEALTLSVVAGLAEYVTEKIPLDNILKNLGAPDETTVAKNLLEVLKRSILQMPTEGAEEALSDYINLIADGLVRADRSDFMQQIRDMEAMGYSKQEAVSAAILENVIKGPALSALGGAISGAVLGGGSSLLGYELYGSRGNAQSIQEQQLARVAETLGENGGKALQNAYLGTEDTADYAAGFSEYYEAGRKGQEVTESRYGDALNEVQKKAAYESGQMDAKKEAKKATFAQEKSTESGLVLDKYVSEHLNDHEIDRINTVSKMLGVRARFVEENSIRGGTANATISGDEVLIEQNNPNPVLFLVGHELTHRLQDIAETEYIAYRDSVQDMLAEEANQKRELYAKYGVNLTYEQALDEAAADFAGELAMGGEALDRFIANHKDNRTLLQKVLDALRSVTDKLTGAEKKRAEAAWGRTFTKEEWQGFKQAEKKLIQALKAGEKNANEGSTTNQYSLKGKYWRPNLSSKEWGLLNHRMDAEINDPTHALDEITQWAYADEKGTTVFAIYGIGDGTEATPLYASGGKTAAADYQAFMKYGEEFDYGADRSGEAFNRLFKALRREQRQSNGDLPDAQRRSAENGHDRVSAERAGNDGRKSNGYGQQTGGEVNKRFSLKAPVEETDKLLALHNKDENSILAAIKLGGLPMPSIAIVKARDGHTKYGPISLVFSKDTIDPQLFRANKVYGGDAWTPTAPRVDYPVNSKKASQVEHELHRLAGDVSVAGGIFGNSAALRSMGIDDTSTRSTAELAEKLASTDTVRAAYLADQGKSLEPVKMDKVWDKFGNDTLQKVVDRLGVNTLAEIEANLETGESVKDALGENAEVIRDILRDYYREQGEPMLRRMAVKRHWTDAEINERRQTRIDNSMDGVSIFTLEDIVHHAWDMYQDGGATKGEIDRMATSDALRSAVDDHAVEEWIAGKLDGLLGEAGIYNGKDPYTPSGNLRSFSQLHYAYTLENIVKAMKEGQEERGGNTWGASAKTLQSVATPEYRSIQEIKADSGRLGMDEGAEHEAKLQAIDDQIGSIITKIKQGNKAHSDNSFVESDIIGSILMETSKGKRTVDAIMRAFSKEGYKISSQTAQDIQAVYQEAAEMPTGYFEAKPQRAVGFDEVLAAVIPDDSSKKLRDGLEQAGVRMLEYKTGDDADRLAKINSVDDARFSLKGTEESRELSRLKKETEALKERVSYWKGQTKESTAVTTDKKSIEKKARQIVKDYGAQVDAAEIGADLTSLYNYIANNGDGKNELTGDEAWSRAREIARKVVENAVAVDDELYREYKDLRAYLKKTPLTISETDSRDIADFEAFRKENFGRLNVKKGETGNIDQVYTELMERWPEFFNGEQSNSVDMLTTIADVMRDIYDRTEGNPFSVYMEEAVNGAANDIMESFFELPQTRPTFADKQARKLEKAIADGKIRTQKAVEREKSRRANEVTKLKDRFAAKEKNGREAQNARVLRNRIEKHVSALSEKLLRPSDKKHIPEELRQSVAAMLNAINRESLYTIDENGKRHKNGEGDPVKRTEAFRALKAQYENILNSGDLVIDPDLMSNLDAVAEMEDIPLAKMNTEQLTTVWQAVKAVEASVSSANKLFAAGKYETVSAAAEAIKMNNIRKKNKANYLETVGKIDKALNIDMLTPQAFFHRLGQSGDEMFRTMRKAQDKHITIMAQAQEEMAKIAGGRAVQNLEKETHTFRLSEGNVTMSTAQIMSLYALMQRDQGKQHVLNGGIRPDTVQGKSRFVDAGRSDAIQISEGEVQDILNTLTDEQKHMADRIQNYFSTTLSDLGNEASMEVYGYKKFNEEHYFPIESDKQQLKTDVTKEAEGGTIAGRGFTKSTYKKATNAVMLRSIFDVAANHISDMATYNAWLGTITDVQRIWNYTFRDELGENLGTVKDIFARVFGKGGNTYMGQLLRDLNNGIKGNGGTLTSGLTANFKAAAIGANLRVIIQQPTAILRAMSEIDPAYLLAGSLRRGDWAKVQKYSPLSVWKDWGYFDVSTGRQMKNVLFSDDSRLERVKQASMALAGKADSFAWSRLWNAIELETKAMRKDLTPGSNAFYETVADRFEDVIDKTQVVDGILQRSQYMRNPDGLVKMASSFMAEPTKTYNQFLNAVYDLQNASEGEGKKKAKKYLARTTFALVSSFAVNAVMQSLMDALRDDDKEKKYWEKFVEAYTGLTGDEENFLTGFRNFMYGNFGSNFDPTSYVPFVKDIASVVQGYDVSRMDMDTISDLYRSMTNMNKALNGEGKMSLAAASAAMFAQAARLYGVPVANLKRDVEAAIKTAAIETDSYLMQYRIDKALMNLNYSGNRKNFLDILYNAYQNDEEEYEIIYADMVASGFDEAAIISGMESRMKKSQGVESVAELEQRFLSPSMQKQYDTTMSRIQSSSIWKQSDETQQKAVQDNVYDLLNGTDEKLAEKVNGAAQQGIDESQYILYMAAQKLADAANRNPEKRNGTIDQQEAAAAIDMMGGLSNAQKSYLWQSTNKGWKEKNNPYR